MEKQIPDADLQRMIQRYQQILMDHYEGKKRLLPSDYQLFNQKFSALTQEWKRRTSPQYTQTFHPEHSECSELESNLEELMASVGVALNATTCGAQFSPQRPTQLTGRGVAAHDPVLLLSCIISRRKPIGLLVGGDESQFWSPQDVDVFTALAEYGERCGVLKTMQLHVPYQGYDIVLYRKDTEPFANLIQDVASGQLQLPTEQQIPGTEIFTGIVLGYSKQDIRHFVQQKFTTSGQDFDHAYHAWMEWIASRTS